VDVSASMDAPCSPARLFGLVDELTDYPRWMPLIHHVEPDAAATDSLAWFVELRARVGPFARSKRLRMARVVHDAEDRAVRFERAEMDGRQHSTWRLDAHVLESDGGSRLDMRLHYGGALWTGGVMERVLADQIVSGRERLLSLASEDSGSSGLS
jgi:ribosome-associated toxin RatA of RatAB toxin-antitoxin module